MSTGAQAVVDAGGAELTRIMARVEHRMSELAAGHGAGSELASMAATANDGGMLPEQVWDQNPPSGQPGFAPGTPTFSATPLAWTHAQFIRLAWSIAAGRPVEQPAVIACRYVRTCR